MNRKRTATTTNALLGLLALRPQWSTYAITQTLRRNMRFFWPRVESQIYNEAKRLIDRGLAQSKEEKVGQRTRNVYSISPTGRKVLAEWLATPPSATKLECEPLLRIFFADFCTAEQLHIALKQVKDDAQAIMDAGRVVGPEYIQGNSPFQDQVHVRALVFDFLWNHARMLQSWAERTETMIDQWERLSPDERVALSQALIRANLDTEKE